MFYISVTQLGRKCSKEAIVTAQARLPEKQMSEILAEEEGKFIHVQITPFLFLSAACWASLMHLFQIHLSLFPFFSFILQILPVKIRKIFLKFHGTFHFQDDIFTLLETQKDIERIVLKCVKNVVFS